MIRAYRERWEEMLGGAIEDTVTILDELHANGIRLLALTNWAVYFDSTNRIGVSSKIMMRQVIDLMLHGMVERAV